MVAAVAVLCGVATLLALRISVASDGPAPLELAAGSLPPRSGLPLVEPRPADDFVDSIGVNTHLRYNDTAYADFAAVERRLVESGIRHIRDDIAARRPDTYPLYRRLAKQGIRSTVILGSPLYGGEGSPWGTPEELVRVVQRELLPSGAVEAVEGANEWDLSDREAWVAELREHHQDVSRLLSETAALSSLPVIAPSMGRPLATEQFIELGSLAALTDYGNVHDYPGDKRMRREFLDEVLANQSIMTGDQQVIATETGYHQGRPDTDEGSGHQAVSADAAGVLVPQLLLEHFEAGIPRTFLYELVDQHDRPSDIEANFGLLRSDFTPKPAFEALTNLIGLLEGRGSVPDLEPLGLTVEAGRGTVGTTLLQARDDTWFLLVWRQGEPEDGDPCTRAPEGQVTVRFDRPMSGISVHRPLCDDRVEVTTPSGGVTVELPEDVLVLELDAP